MYSTSIQEDGAHVRLPTHVWFRSTVRMASSSLASASRCMLLAYASTCSVLLYDLLASKYAMALSRLAMASRYGCTWDALGPARIRSSSCQRQATPHSQRVRHSLDPLLQLSKGSSTHR